MLKTGNADWYAQNKAALLLEALTDRSPGRPPQRLPSDPLQGLAWFVDYQEGRRAAEGHPHPFEAALDDLREAHNDQDGVRLSDQTLHDYYRKSTTKNGANEARFARTIDAGSPDEALSKEAGGDPGLANVYRKSYDRGSGAPSEAGNEMTPFSFLFCGL